MGKKNEAPPDMHSVIVKTILEGRDFPLKISKSNREKFANEIADICISNSFIKGRESFRREVGKVIERYVVETISGD